MRKSVTIRIGDVSLASDGENSEVGDIAALEAFSTSTNAPAQLTGWATSGMTLDPAPEGVTVTEINGENRVTELNISDKGLTGQIPTGVINLKKCTYFNYFYNSLDGVIPAHPPSSVYLYFNTSTNVEPQQDPHINATEGGQDNHPGYQSSQSGNHFTGGIGDWIGQCVDLEWFWCNHSRLNGTISPLMANCTKMKGFGIWHNSWVNLEIPDMFAGWTGLTHLLIGYYNSTNTNDSTGSGVRPTFDTDWPSSLNGLNPRFVRIKRTGITETFPNLSGWTNIRTLQLGWNNFSGGLPHYTLDGTWPNLAYFNFVGNNMTGTLPATIPTLGPLNVLTFTFNDIQGSIPDSLWENNPAIINTDFSYNPRLSGQIKNDLTILTRPRNLQWRNTNIDGPWPVLDWGTSKLNGFTRFQASNCRHNFADMIPTFANYQAELPPPELFNYSPQQELGEAENRSVFEGENVLVENFNDVFSHPDNTYQWQKDGVNLSGETFISLLIENFQSADEGDYQLIVDNPNIPMTIRSQIVNIQITVE